VRPGTVGTAASTAMVGQNRRAGSRRRRAGTLVASCIVVAGGLVGSFVGTTAEAGARTYGSGGTAGSVLLVGTFDGHAGPYTTIQSAVDAAKPGDWILIAPGDYHENADESGIHADPSDGYMGGVMIDTPDIHLRGMSRSGVIVDGTKAGSPACSSDPADQNFGAAGPNGQAVGRNGILVWKADDVSVENLTACNFLAGTGDSGNEIWWNGGADSGKIGLKGYSGSYLTATSTFFSTVGTADQQEQSAAQYGIFSSNSAGPGTWDQLYASNFNDSGMYVGACHQLCGITIDHAWMEFNALGYSGTNSGGAVVVENSKFDNNQDGFDTNTQINGDPPAPQNGDCPRHGISPITRTHSCWVFMHNVVVDNNNPDVPEEGNAAAGPVGTGMTLSGGRNDTVMDNTFSDNGAWGFLMVPYPDSGTPSLHQSCPATGGVETAGFGCVYDPEHDALLDNTFSHDGYFGNPSNADFGQITLDGNQPQNCFAGNVDPDGSAPTDLEQIDPTCGKTAKAANTGGALLGQVLCDTGFGSCPSGSTYPVRTGVVMHPLPTDLKGMPNPCQGVPANAWCPHGKPA